MPTFQNDTSKRLQVEDIEGRLVTVAPGETVQSYKWLSSPDWSITADTPYYQIIVDDNTVIGAGAGFESLNVDPDAHVLEIRADVAVTIHANAEAAEGYPVIADVPVQIRHDGNIGVLKINFSGAGNCRVIEIKD